MKDYTEIFSEAINISSGYNIEKICNIINSIGNNYCGTDDEWCDYNWYYLCKETESNQLFDVYGYLSREYPVALIKKNCPEIIISVLAENKILFTEFEEPLCCDQDILRRYVHFKRVIDESAFLNGGFAFDDERFELILQRIENGRQYYIDAGNFMFDEIQTD